MDALVPRWPEANERPFAVGRFSGASSYSSFTDFRFKDLANAQSAPRVGSRSKRRRNGKAARTHALSAFGQKTFGVLCVFALKGFFSPLGISTRSAQVSTLFHYLPTTSRFSILHSG
jgi:hypothetical protein